MPQVCNVNLLDGPQRCRVQVHTGIYLICKGKGKFSFVFEEQNKDISINHSTIYVVDCFRNMWMAGSSFVFESVFSVLEYNNLLINQAGL